MSLEASSSVSGFDGIVVFEGVDLTPSVMLSVSRLLLRSFPVAEGSDLRIEGAVLAREVAIPLEMREVAFSSSVGTAIGAIVCGCYDGRMVGAKYLY